LFPDASFEQGAVRLAPGEALVACTDGILEACNPDGVEFGEHNVLTAARSQTGSADTMLNAALRALRSWSDGLPFEDDATLLVARLNESAVARA
jgi:serine phosphatase RsbU (regulator of sigma subunit)